MSSLPHRSANAPGKFPHPNRWPEVSKANPCPKCGKPDWCKIAPDGTAVICNRTSSDKPCGQGHLHRLSEPVRVAPNTQQKHANGPTDFPAEARRTAGALTPDRKRELAASLGLPTEALDALPLVGFRADDPSGPCFTFPEVDATGAVIGISRRYADGRKRSMSGSHRGLTVPGEWRDRTGPVFVVEGATDTAAMTVCGLACVGRPSNSGGGALLAEMLHEVPIGRAIIVAGENDQKEGGAWPGREGAESVARALVEKLRRPVRVALPPADAKDVRAWLTASDRHGTDWPARGAELRSLLEAAARTFEPPADLINSSAIPPSPAPDANPGTPAPSAKPAPDAQDKHPVYDNGPLLTRMANLWIHDKVRYAKEKERLVNEHDLRSADLVAAIRQVASGLPLPESAKPSAPDYEVVGNVIHHHNRSNQRVALCDFNARVVAAVKTDDGSGEERSAFRLVGACANGAPLPEIEVPVSQFGSMEWVLNKWGGRALVYPAQESHLRTALLKLSNGWATETVYTHTGWREIGGRWFYLHADGAISADGPAAGMKVTLPGQLAFYRLPAPQVGERLRAAVRASLGIVSGDLVADEAAFPVLLAPYRAALGGADYSFALVGRSGSRKSSLAALAQQHFGSEMDLMKLPSNFSGTANAVASLAFSAKDALFVVDDYSPKTLREKERQDGIAERVVRGQSNGQGRDRANRNGDATAPRPPRALCFLSCEDVPGTASAESLRARLWIVDVSRDSVSLPALTGCQERAAAGLYAEALSGFIRWLAADHAGRRDRFRADMRQRRADLLGIGGHPKVATTLADLLTALDLVLEFATAVNAIDRNEARAIQSRGESAMRNTATAQGGYNQDADPAVRFLNLFASVLSSGRGHLVSVSGERPEADDVARAVGWRLNGSIWVPQGDQLGWHVRDRIYLNPHPAMGAVVRLSKEEGQELVITPKVLWKQLHEAKHVAEVEEAKGDKSRRYVVQKRINGARPGVVVLHTQSVLGRNNFDAPEDGYP